MLKQKFEKIGMTWNSGEVGATGGYIFNIFKPKNDHIFSRNMNFIESGKLANSSASDHFPIGVNLSFQ
jgi:endonuclease/exonuclease/phosphatase (EEP) superfamily protein YafD